MYNHLTREKRIALATLLREGYSHNHIASSLGVHPSTVGRELKRNPYKDGYHATHADVVTMQRRKESKQKYRKIEQDDSLKKRIVDMLHPLVSPEVVAHEVGIHHQTIYSWIRRSELQLKVQLPYKGRKRRRYGTKRQVKQGWTKNVHSIDERPDAEVSFEGDTVKGGTKSQLLTHVEMKSLFTLVHKIPDGTADSVHAQMKKEPLFKDSVGTYDRGSEFALWQMIEKDLNMKIYFARAHHPWQRGKNENTNGRIRRVFPKKFDFSTITQKDVDKVVHLMNHTKRKSLNWRTPCSVFGRCCTST